MKDIVIYKETTDNFYLKVHKIRSLLDYYFFSYQEHNYLDRYIFSDIKIRKNIVVG